MPLPEVLDAYKDLGVPEETTGSKNRLNCDPTFNRYTSFWALSPTLDSSYAAVEALQTLPTRDGDELLRENRDGLFRFLRNHFRPEDGTFGTNGSERTRGVFACHSAIGLIKGLRHKDCDERISVRVFNNAVRTSVQGTREAGKVSPTEGVLQSLKQAREASPYHGLVVDHPLSPTPPSLTVLYTANSVVWNLYQDQTRRKFYELVDRSPVRRFIQDCFKRVSLGGGEVVGFSIHPAVQELCANTTYFGVRLLDHLSLRDEILSPEDQQGICLFLERICFSGDGFCSTVYEAPSLNATYFSLRTLKYLDPRRYETFIRRHFQKLLFFLEDCTNKDNGGAAFTFDLDRYVENCLATRYRSQIVELIEEVCPGVADRGYWAEEGFRFLSRQLDSKTGGFLAYPDDRITASGLTRSKLERYLEKKDQVLLESLDDEPWNVDAEARYLYNQLALLQRKQVRDNRAAIDPMIERVSARLEALESWEADRYLGEAQEALLGPVIAGEKLMAEVEELRRKYGDTAS